MHPDKNGGTDAAKQRLGRCWSWVLDLVGTLRCNRQWPCHTRRFRQVQENKPWSSMIHVGYSRVHICRSTDGFWNSLRSYVLRSSNHPSSQDLCDCGSFWLPGSRQWKSDTRHWRRDYQRSERRKRRRPFGSSWILLDPFGSFWTQWTINDCQTKLFEVPSGDASLWDLGRRKRERRRAHTEIKIQIWHKFSINSLRQMETLCVGNWSL